MMNTFTLDEFDFNLPPDRIAQEPVRPRDSARLLEIGQTLNDCVIRDLPKLLKPGDLLIINDTKVIPARLYGKRGKVNVEATLHRHVEKNMWRAFARPGRRLRLNDIIVFGEDLCARVERKLDDGEIILDFITNDLALSLVKNGEMPLPPYINRLPKSQEADYGNYQTIYAKKPGAVAAPTAGLHFTQQLFDKLASNGIRFAKVTLHVGPGTFLPVRNQRPEGHVMHAEVGRLSSKTANLINDTRSLGKRIVAVGTTSLRLVESAASENGEVNEFDGETDLFILPGYKFKAVDMLITNFHLPKSTLFMLVSAFSGLERIQNAYQHAIKDNYRFYSYGDACLLHRS
ncbi:MAG: tRNA preQ1(34) S-adenosylmethionine ribosyltransferase-isomerase QueA [Pseudomonadota bacterium]|nr:tRNA preQ1(34) S-adenosylmethionine ribosyltransferase-isomerase QueA [Pseudomonadota bacterium]